MMENPNNGSSKVVYTGKTTTTSGREDVRKVVYWPLIAIALIISLSTFAIPQAAFAQKQNVTRTELQRHDISTPGWEAIQVRIDFEKGSSFGMHTHPGEEVIYVLKGKFIYEIAGQGKVVVKEGGTLFIPAGVAHAAYNIGETKAVELGTYIVEKGKPLVVNK